MSLTVHINVDASDQPLGTSGVDFVQFQEGADKLIFTAGNATVADGQPSPSQAELISAGIQLTGSEIIVSDYLLDDASAVLLKSIDLMGNIDAQYVMAFDFDAATASEPVLEVWDDSTYQTASSTILGGGTPSNSFVRGITTTNSPSGSNWVVGANRLAGSTASNFLYLNDLAGALSGAATLYAQLAIVIPASQTTGFSSNFKMVVKWLEN